MEDTTKNQKEWLEKGQPLLKDPPPQRPIAAPNPAVIPPGAPGIGMPLPKEPPPTLKPSPAPAEKPKGDK